VGQLGHSTNVEFEESGVCVSVTLMQELIFVVDSYSFVLAEASFVASVCKSSD